MMKVNHCADKCPPNADKVFPAADNPCLTADKASPVADKLHKFVPREKINFKMQL